MADLTDPTEWVRFFVRFFMNTRSINKNHCQRVSRVGWGFVVGHKRNLNTISFRQGDQT